MEQGRGIQASRRAIAISPPSTDYPKCGRGDSFLVPSANGIVTAGSPKVR